MAGDSGPGRTDMATGLLQAFIQRVRGAEVVRSHAGLTDSELLGRYIEHSDPEAFETLFYRHCSMVYGVCVRTIGEAPDAEDAFQATFLVLARKASSVRPREMVGNWLYGVAYRTALRARAMNAKRRAKEQAAVKPLSPSRDDWEELLPLLDQELNRLPDKYRAPVVL